MFTSQPHQHASRRSRSLSPVRSPRHVVPRRNRSLGRKPVPVGTKRSYDEAFFDDDDDEWIFHPALDPYMETSPSTGSSSDRPSSPPGGVMAGGGPPLLDFEMRPVGPRRNWRDVLHKQRYQVRIQQHREANPTDDLGREVTEALRRTIHRQIKADSSLKPHHTLHFTMQSDGFTHAFQSTTFTMSEFEEGSNRLDTYLQALASRLNSNQAFEADDSFMVETTFIHTPAPGSGHGKRYKPSSAAVRGIVKRSHVTIKNRDALCCARAIVTMKALVDANGNARDHRYHNLKQGRPVQERLAKELHRLAGVPEGPCGISQLQKFQAVLPGYQIKVMSIDPPHMLIFVGPTPSDKIIRIIKEDDHYDGCNSFSGFLSKSYFCDECNRGYNTEDREHHPCEGKWCPSCHRKDCPDFAEAKRLLGPGKFPSPSSLCRLCHRSFFGEDCYSYHLHRRSKNIPSICLTYNKCPDCFKTYEVENAGKSRCRPKQHKCGWGECPICEEQVHVASHQCYIQPIPEEEDDPKLKRVSRNEVGTRHFIEPDAEDADTRVWVERDPSLQVYCDYEVTVDEEGVQTPILLGAESDEEDHMEFFYGADCTKSFLEWLESLAIDQDGDDRNVIAVFHNLKGYDGMFLLQHCYANHREVTDQITIGTKVLSFKSDRLTFKDSLCFLPFPLATFPSTFGIQELVKGFFPHKFNTQENQDYEGPMPPAEMYDPDGMSPKKKAEFERWYTEKVAANYHFVMRREMEAYCESDVKLLKAGCQKFRKEFQQHAEFDPIEKCVAIASASNRFWRKKLLTPNSIATEPMQGWQGARSNQSVKAMKWLAWREHLLRHDSRFNDEPQEDRIRHANNGGEQRVLHFLVDGLDVQNHVVYEFHGCLWHGCPRCHPNHRDRHSKFHPDRTIQELYEVTQQKHCLLRHHGYNLQIMWECDWDREVKSNEDLKQFLASYETVEPLNPRDAFFGGRTNAVRLHHEVNEDQGEQIKYVDVTSLYPWVNKTQQYPIGHHQPGEPRHPGVLWYSQSRCDSPSSPVSSRPALPTWW